MKIQRINQLEGTEREVQCHGCVSIRPVLEKEKMGFSMHKTIIPKGGPKKWHYKHHLEACYCIKGRGILRDIKNDIEHLITPDVVYILDNNDEHTFQALEDTILISVFNPPITGQESHDKEGSYELKNG